IHMYSTKGYAAKSKSSPLAPFSFDRRDPGASDVQIDILFCGVCHSDLHTARGEWGGTKYPCVPGHEIVGRVVKVGRDVKKFREGELAAAAPLLCAGITTYSPLRHWKIGQGHKVGVVGLGGLGHMGVKFANAFGAHVALFTTSPNKTSDAKKLGAHEVILSKDEDEMN